MAEQPDDALAVAYAGAMTRALSRYRLGGDRRALDEAFAEARAAAAILRSLGHAPADPREDPRWVLAAVPAVADLAEFAAGEASRAAAADLAGLWQDLVLGSPPPRWTAAETAAARSAVLVAVAARETQSLEGMQLALRRVGSTRLGSVLADALSVASEQAWAAALGDRYESLVHRCAPRTRFRTLGLAAVVAGDARVRESLTSRLADWLRGGARREDLADAIEPVLVSYRTPDAVA